MNFKAIILFAAVCSGSQAFVLPTPEHENETKIFGGRPISIQSIPWRVQVLTVSGDGDIYNCAGTILSSTWILTAAHCFNPQKDGDQVLVFSGNSTFGQGKRSTIKQQIIHKEYDKTRVTSQHDIALLELNEPLELSSQNNRVAACLAPTFTKNEDINGGFLLLASGWGKTESAQYSQNLLYVQLNALRNSECQKYVPINDLQLCAYTERKGNCQGDSGGSVDVISNNKGVAIGIVSYGPTNPCGTGLPVVYTRVSMFRDWIQGFTGQLSC